VDLSLLRLATFELLARADIPASVTIDEAIEIARRFGSEDSPAFVNGVLDRIAENSSDLARHFEATLHTGTFCSYVPDPNSPLRWEL